MQQMNRFALHFLVISSLRSAHTFPGGILLCVDGWAPVACLRQGIRHPKRENEGDSLASRSDFDATLA